MSTIILLSACARPAPPGSDAPLDARRIVLPAVDPPPGNAGGTPVWTGDGDGARFGMAGAGALLTLACTNGRLVVTRPIAAEVGAGALFAIEGPQRIVRLPVDATALPGQRGFVWQGSIAGADPDSAVFAGPFTGTLPGGGRITVTAGDAARDVVRRCRAAKPRQSMMR